MESLTHLGVLVLLFSMLQYFVVQNCPQERDLYVPYCTLTGLNVAAFRQVLLQNSCTVTCQFCTLDRLAKAKWKCHGSLKTLVFVYSRTAPPSSLISQCQLRAASPFSVRLLASNAQQKGIERNSFEEGNPRTTCDPISPLGCPLFPYQERVQKVLVRNS